MAIPAGSRWPLSRLFRLHHLGETLEQRERRRLARAVRAHAQIEREHAHRAGVVELDSIATRTRLYEAIARRLEETEWPVAKSGLERLRDLLAQPSTFRDYGPRAQARNEHIAEVLNELDPREAADGPTS